MPKLRVFSGAELCAFLGQFGFVNVRQRGSHVIMQRIDESGTVTVPVPYHKEIKRGTLRSIIRQSGLDRSLFEYE